MGDAAYINLEIEALHRGTREMPSQTARGGSAANELVGKERMDVEDRINLGRGHIRAQPKPSAAMRCSIAPSTKCAFSRIASGDCSPRRMMRPS